MGLFRKDSFEVAVEQEELEDLRILENMDPASEKYGIVVDNIGKLRGLKKIKKSKIPIELWPIIISGGISTAQMLLYLHYDDVKVLSSKATNYMMRMTRK